VHIEVPRIVGTTADDVLAKLIAWELLARSLDGLHETAADFAALLQDELGDVDDDAARQQRRFCLAVEYVANSIARDHHDTSRESTDPLVIEARSSEFLRVLEHASEALRLADEALGAGQGQGVQDPADAIPPRMS
jgi:hypothetical protein